MYIEYDFDSLFEITNDESTVPTTTTVLSSTTYKVPAPSQYLLVFTGATQYDFEITEEEYNKKKLITSTFDVIDGLKLTTDYTLAYVKREEKKFQTVITPTISDANYPKAEQDMLALFNSMKNYIEPYLDNKISSGGSAIYIGIQNSWNVFKTAIEDYFNDTERTRWYLYMPSPLSSSDTNYITWTLLYKEQAAWARSAKSLMMSNYITNFATYHDPLILKLRAMGNATVLSKWVFVYGYGVQITYKIKNVKLIDVVLENTYYEITKSKLDNFFNNFLDKIKNHYSLVSKTQLTVNSVKNGKVKTITTTTYQELSPNEAYYESKLSTKYIPNPKTSTSTQTLSNTKTSIDSFKYTIKNNDGSIYMVLYYNLEYPNDLTINPAADPMPRTPSNPVHSIKIDVFNGDPTSLSSKQIFNDYQSLPGDSYKPIHYPYVGGDNATTLTSFTKGKLHLNISDNHFYVVSRFEKVPSSGNFTYFGLLISKFINNTAKWFDTYKINPLISTILMKSQDDILYTGISKKAYTPVKYNPFTEKYSYDMDANYDILNYNKYYNIVTYVDQNSTKQLILSHILIKDHAIGLFGNISKISEIYMIIGHTDIKCGKIFTVTNGQKFIRFGSYCMRVE